MADTEHIEESKRCTLFDRPAKFCQRCSEFHTSDEWMDTCERYLGGAPIRKCKTCGGWHPLDRWSGNCMPEPNWNRSDLAAPMLISDNLGGINGILSHADGKRYTSKAKLRAEYRARGVVEIGNECARTPTAERIARPEQADKELEADIVADLRKTREILTSDNFSNDEMANMLRPENAPVDMGFSVGATEPI